MCLRQEIHTQCLDDNCHMDVGVYLWMFWILVNYFNETQSKCSPPSYVSFGLDDTTTTETKQNSVAGQ